MLRAALACLLGTAFAACAPARNFTDPAGPRYASDGRTERSALGRTTPDSLVIVSFNIKYGREIERAIAVLRAPPLRGADVVALQEVDEEDATRIARALHLEYVYYPIAVHPLERRNFGNAVLSAWPLERDWKLVLPHLSATRAQRRGATAAVLRAGDVRITVYSAHLELPLSLSPAARREQAAALIADAAAAPSPVIIAGDMNGADVAWQFVEAGYAWVTRDIGPTALVFRADHVFARGLVDAGASAFDDRDASDHLPVRAVLRLPAAVR